MVHNGLEYGIIAAYAEGMNILRRAGVGTEQRATDSETAPLRHPEFYRYDLDLRDIAEVWRRGSVIASWPLDPVDRPGERSARHPMAARADSRRAPSSTTVRDTATQAVHTIRVMHT